MKNVAISGLAATTALGNSVQDLFQASVEGISGIKYNNTLSQRFRKEICSALINREKNNSDIQHKQKIITDVIHRAIDDAGIDNLNNKRVCLILGTFLGGRGDVNVQVNAKEYSLETDIGIDEIKKSISRNVKSLTVCTACTASANAIGIGKELVAHNKVDIAIVGGYEFLGDYVFAGMNSLRTLSNNIRPFDIDRNGTVLGEAIGIMILESQENILQTKRNIYAYVSGYGYYNDNYHLLRPSPEGIGIEIAMKNALAQSGNLGAKINYINSHGTGTVLNDDSELNAIKNVLVDSVFISSTKPVTGHTLGASGVIEGIISVLALQSNKIPPTINTKNIKSQSNIVLYNSIDRNIEAVMSNSIGFGGNNSSLVFTSYPTSETDTSINKTNVITKTFDLDANIASPAVIYDLAHSQFKDFNRNSCIITVANDFCQEEAGQFYDSFNTRDIRRVSPSLFSSTFPAFYLYDIVHRIGSSAQALIFQYQQDEGFLEECIEVLLLKNKEKMGYSIHIKKLNNQVVVKKYS